MPILACKFCETERFQNGNGCGWGSPFTKMHYMSLIPRLQQLYASKKSAQRRLWHKNHVTQASVITHSSEGEVWKHFDKIHASFVAKMRDIRLSLCATGFSPYSNPVRSYSVWAIGLCIQLTTAHVHDASLNVFVICYSWSTQPIDQDRCVPIASHWWIEDFMEWRCRYIQRTYQPNFYNEGDINVDSEWLPSLWKVIGMEYTCGIIMSTLPRSNIRHRSTIW